MFVRLCGNEQWRQHKWDIRERTGERERRETLVSPDSSRLFPTPLLPLFFVPLLEWGKCLCLQMVPQVLRKLQEDENTINFFYLEGTIFPDFLL